MPTSDERAATIPSAGSAGRLVGVGLGVFMAGLVVSLAGVISSSGIVVLVSFVVTFVGLVVAVRGYFSRKGRRPGFVLAYLGPLLGTAFALALVDGGIAMLAGEKSAAPNTSATAVPASSPAQAAPPSAPPTLQRPAQAKQGTLGVFAGEQVSALQKIYRPFPPNDLAYTVDAMFRGRNDLRVVGHEAEYGGSNYSAQFVVNGSNDIVAIELVRQVNKSPKDHDVKVNGIKLSMLPFTLIANVAVREAVSDFFKDMMTDKLKFDPAGRTEPKSVGGFKLSAESGADMVIIKLVPSS